MHLWEQRCSQFSIQRSHVKDCKVGINKGKYEQKGEDLEAKRPGDEKQNKKWQPDCGPCNSFTPSRGLKSTSSASLGTWR